MARKPRKFNPPMSVESSVDLEVVVLLMIGVGEAVLGKFFGEEAPGLLTGTHW